ncbi:hypothetical protein ACW73L_21785 [Methylolobus aquaticus]
MAKSRYLPATAFTPLLQQITPAVRALGLAPYSQQLLDTGKA